MQHFSTAGTGPVSETRKFGKGPKMFDFLGVLKQDQFFSFNLLFRLELLKAKGLTSK